MVEDRLHAVRAGLTSEKVEVLALPQSDDLKELIQDLDLNKDARKLEYLTSKLSIGDAKFGTTTNFISDIKEICQKNTFIFEHIHWYNQHFTPEVLQQIVDFKTAFNALERDEIMKLSTDNINIALTKFEADLWEADSYSGREIRIRVDAKRKELEDPKNKPELNFKDGLFLLSKNEEGRKPKTFMMFYVDKERDVSYTHAKEDDNLVTLIYNHNFKVKTYRPLQAYITSVKRNNGISPYMGLLIGLAAVIICGLGWLPAIHVGIGVVGSIVAAVALVFALVITSDGLEDVKKETWSQQ
jgi:hypothetical protein